jgi:hypothetical protein
MVGKIVFWTGFGKPLDLSSLAISLAWYHALTPQGLATRFLQLGIEMRPFFNKESLWVWPLFGGIGGSFGYWMQGVEQRQYDILSARKSSLLEKRARRAEREAQQVGSSASS